jgi:hypothetical protein
VCYTKDQPSEFSELEEESLNTFARECGEKQGDQESSDTLEEEMSVGARDPSSWDDQMREAEVMGNGRIETMEEDVDMEATEKEGEMPPNGDPHLGEDMEVDVIEKGMSRGRPNRTRKAPVRLGFE